MVRSKCVILCALLFVVHAQDLLMSGSFTASVVQEGSLEHGSGILAYDPNTDEFIDTFNGGVYVNYGEIQVLRETVQGIMGAGFFKFLDNGQEYSNSVLSYDSDEDDYVALNDGIWRKAGDSVRYISSVNSEVVFAGTFSTVESISLQDYNNGDAPTVVPNIVKMNNNKEYSLLNDPNHIFPNSHSDSIQGLAGSNDGETVFIHSINKGIYSWDNVNYYKLLVPITNMTHNTLTVDGNDNLYGIVKTSAGNVGTGGITYTFYLAVFNATRNYASSYLQFLQLNTQLCELSPEGYSTTVILTAWNGGILISYPDYSTCNTTLFTFFNATTGSFDPSFSRFFPGGPFNLDSIVPGEGNDLWATNYLPTYISEKDFIYYYKAASSSWEPVSLAPVISFTPLSLVWDSVHNELIVFVVDTTSGFYQPKLVSVSTATSPPSGSTLLHPGNVCNIGIANGITVVQDGQDSGIYVGGIFDFVGSGTKAFNLAKFTNGAWEPINSEPVKVLYSYQSEVYIGFLLGATSGEVLPIGVLNGDAFPNLPVVTHGSGTVTALFADSNYVFVGGDFTCQLPGSGQSANAVVVFNKQNQTWYDLGIPNTINSAGSGYLINSFDVNSVNGSSILVIGGYFSFSVGGFEYGSLALYNLDGGFWLPAYPFSSATQISDVLFADSGTLYLSGLIDVAVYDFLTGVASYNLNSAVISSVGEVGYYVSGIAIYTDEEQREYLFAAGLFDDPVGALIYTELGTTNQTWVPAGSNILPSCFFGSVTHLV